MRDRRTLVAIVVLALAVGVAQVLLWWLRPANRNDQFVGPPRSGYSLRDFTLDAYGEDGHLSFRLRSPYLQRREGDESLYLNAPSFLLPPQHGAAGLPWTGHSEYGWVSANADLLKLQGKVVMQRPAFDGSPAASIHTSDVTAWPKQNRVATEAPAEIRQGTATMHSVGLRANLDTKYLELLHDFHGTFKPSSHDR